LKDLLQCRDSGVDFLSALTAFVNVVLAGRCPSAVAPFFFGGRLLALNKKDGGIRPIAIGMTLRRLVSKCAATIGSNQLADWLSPHQLGVGAPGGCETAVHAARRYLEAMPPGHVVAKLDFRNAFNSIHRRDLLMAVSARLPQVYSYCFSAYAQPSFLFHGPFRILSQEGIQQGDPLGPLLFCNSIHPLLQSLDSLLKLGYLDDLTVAGPEETVATDVSRVIQIGGSMGLQLNVSKCELICAIDSIITDPTLSSFKIVQPIDSTLLGAPLFPGTALDRAWTERCTELSRIISRLDLVGAQDALILLRGSFGAPKVQHLLRCSPSFESDGPSAFDKLLRSAVCQISNSSLTDIQWIQASLPIKDGGLGIRRVSSLAFPAFLASAASTLPLQDRTLVSVTCHSDVYFETCLHCWSSQHGISVGNPFPSRQAFWDHPGVLADRNIVESSLGDARSRACYLAAGAPHTGSWLQAMPVSNCGLKLDDEAVRVAVGLRLGLNLCLPHSCPCGTLVDADGLHAFVCKRASNRTTRHWALNDIVWRAFTSAGIPAIKEPPGLARTDGKRPDGLSLIPWHGGKSVTWDVTVVCALANSYVELAAREAGAVAEHAAANKIDKYSSLPACYIFEPVAVDNLGTLNSSAIVFLSDLGRRISSITGNNNETTFLFQRISVAIQRFNATLLRESFVMPDDSDS
jgi:hypothetical protein